MTTFYKYHGAGNDFLIADNREGAITLSPDAIAALCHRRYGIGADGLMLLESGRDGCDYGMAYYNSDGSSGMMCGNGGRCIVAFADRCGIRHHRFAAADGVHHAEILSRSGNTLTVELQMSDVDYITCHNQPDIAGYFLDTGTRHLVCEVEDLPNYDVYNQGKRLRMHPAFAPIGTNVNFIQCIDGTLHVRTFEKGVEDETYACGTGITAAAIAHWHATHQRGPLAQPITVPIRALHDTLQVRFTPTEQGATHVFLIGPATIVAAITPIIQ